MFQFLFGVIFCVISLHAQNGHANGRANRCTCGEAKYPLPTTEVKEATYKHHKYPWLVRIDYTNELRGGLEAQASCNGVLIDSMHVLTSSLCKSNTNKQIYKVHVNRHKITATSYNPKRFIQKPQTIKINATNVFEKDNLMIITLNKPTKAMPICMRPRILPRDDFNFGEKDGISIGWKYYGSAKKLTSYEPRETVLKAKKYQKNSEEFTGYSEIMDFHRMLLEPSDLGEPIMKTLNGVLYLEGIFVKNSERARNAVAVRPHIYHDYWIRDHAPNVCEAPM